MPYATYDTLPLIAGSRTTLDAAIAAAAVRTTAQDPISMVIFGDSTHTTPAGEGKYSINYLMHLLAAKFRNIPATGWCHYTQNSYYGNLTHRTNLGTTYGQAVCEDGYEFTSTGASDTTLAFASWTWDQTRGDKMLVGRMVKMWDGPAVDQRRRITAYNATTKTITVDAFSATPVTGNKFSIEAMDREYTLPGITAVLVDNPASGGIGGSIHMDYNASTATPTDMVYPHIAIPSNLATGTAAGQIIAATISGSGAVSWAARPRATCDASSIGTATGSGTLTDARLNSATPAVYRLTDVTLPYSVGTPYMLMRLESSSASPVRLATARIVSDNDRTGIAVTTCSRGGYTSASLLTNHPNSASLLTAMSPDIIVFAYGTNDASTRTAAQFYTSMAANITWAKAACPNAAIVLVYAPYRTGIAGAQITEWDQMAGALYTLATENGCLFVNMRKQLEPFGWNSTGQATFLADGVHFTQAGGRLWAEAMASAVLDPVTAVSTQLATDQAAVAGVSGKFRGTILGQNGTQAKHIGPR